MKTINVSKGKINFSQRNNEIDPLVSCNTTCMTMALSYIPKLWDLFIKSENFRKFNKIFKQEEDCLRRYILNQGCDPTVHAVLSDMTNKFIGKKVTYFSTNTQVSDILSDLKSGLPVILSGSFPGYPTPRKNPLGHLVVLVGAEWDNDGYELLGCSPDRWIIDDPYGNTLNDWKGSGNDIKIQSNQFDRWMKPTNELYIKWTHRFLLN